MALDLDEDATTSDEDQGGADETPAPAPTKPPKPPDVDSLLKQYGAKPVPAADTRLDALLKRYGAKPAPPETPGPESAPYDKDISLPAEPKPKTPAPIPEAFRPGTDPAEQAINMPPRPMTPPSIRQPSRGDINLPAETSTEPPASLVAPPESVSNTPPTPSQPTFLDRAFKAVQAAWPALTAQPDDALSQLESAASATSRYLGQGARQVLDAITPSHPAASDETRALPYTPPPSTQEMMDRFSNAAEGGAKLATPIAAAAALADLPAAGLLLAGSYLVGSASDRVSDLSGADPTTKRFMRNVLQLATVLGGSKGIEAWRAAGVAQEAAVGATAATGPAATAETVAPTQPTPQPGAPAAPTGGSPNVIDVPPGRYSVDQPSAPPTRPVTPSPGGGGGGGGGTSTSSAPLSRPTPSGPMGRAPQTEQGPLATETEDPFATLLRKTAQSKAGMVEDLLEPAQGGNYTPEQLMQSVGGKLTRQALKELDDAQQMARMHTWREQLVDAALRINREHPTWSVEDVRAAAREEVGEAPSAPLVPASLLSEVTAQTPASGQAGGGPAFTEGQRDTGALGLLPKSPEGEPTPGGPVAIRDVKVGQTVRMDPVLRRFLQAQAPHLADQPDLEVSSVQTSPSGAIKVGFDGHAPISFVPGYGFEPQRTVDLVGDVPRGTEGGAKPPVGAESGSVGQISGSSSQESGSGGDVVNPPVGTSALDRKVLDPVVRAIPVEVVNVLGGEERAAEMLLHEPTVLADRLAANSDPGVVAQVRSLLPVVASRRAELAADADLGGGSPKYDAALDAFHSHLSKAMAGTAPPESTTGGLPGLKLPATAPGTEAGASQELAQRPGVTGAAEGAQHVDLHGGGSVAQAGKGRIAKAEKPGPTERQAIVAKGKDPRVVGGRYRDGISREVYRVEHLGDTLGEARIYIESGARKGKTVRGLPDWNAKKDRVISEGPHAETPAPSGGEAPAGGEPSGGGEQRPAPSPSGVQPAGKRQARVGASLTRAERAPTTEADVILELVEAAIKDGYVGTPGKTAAERIDELRRYLYGMLEAIKDFHQEFAEAGADPYALLRAIARYGGIGIEAEGALKGELRWLKEFQTTKDRGFRQGEISGVLNVLKRDGLSVDDMLTSLRQDQQWQHLHTHSDLLDALRDAATAPPPLDAVEELRRGLGVDWWKNVNPYVQPAEEPPPIEDEDLSFDPDVLEAQPPGGFADKLDSGEEQERLPGTEGARQAGRQATPFKAPQQASGGMFDLTRPNELPEPDTQATLFPSDDDEPSFREREPVSDVIAPGKPDTQVTISHRESDGTVTPVQAEAWTTDVPGLVIAKLPWVEGPDDLGLGYSITHQASGYALPNSQGTFADLQVALGLLKHVHVDWTKPMADLRRLGPRTVARIAAAVRDGIGQSDNLSFNRREPEPLLAPGPEFYSALTRAAELLPQARGTPSQMLAMVEKARGVKPEEVALSGVREWVKSLPEKVLTREALVDYLKANELQLVEVWHGRLRGEHERSPEGLAQQRRIQALEQEQLQHERAYERASDELRLVLDGVGVTTGVDSLVQLMIAADRQIEPGDEETDAGAQVRGEAQYAATNLDRLNLPMRAHTLLREMVRLDREQQYVVDLIAGEEHAASIEDRLGGATIPLAYDPGNHRGLWLGGEYSGAREFLLVVPRGPLMPSTMTWQHSQEELNMVARGGRAGMHDRWTAEVGGHQRYQITKIQEVENGGLVHRFVLDSVGMYDERGVSNSHWATLQGAQNAAEQKLRGEELYHGQTPRPGAYRREAYRGGHWGSTQPNVVAHLRFTTRTDAKGQLLFIEELQSDWHQEGRKVGYKTPYAGRPIAEIDQEMDALSKEAEALYADVDPDALMKMEAPWLQHAPPGWTDDRQATRVALQARGDALQTERDRATNHERWLVQDAKGHAVGRYGVYEEALEAARHYREKTGKEADVSEKAAVPDAPWKTSWAEMAMRRMVLYAVEHGYESIGWTTGEQQIERYTSALKNVVDGIGYQEIRPGIWKLDLRKNDRSIRESVNKKFSQLTTSELPGAVGEEIAAKIRAGEGAKNAGENPPVRVFQWNDVHGDPRLGDWGIRYLNGDYDGHYPTREEAQREFEVILARREAEAPLAKERVLSGVDLVVGGHGMRESYDRILPLYLNKFGKPYGATVGETTIQTGKRPDPAYAVTRAQGEAGAGRRAKRLARLEGLGLTPLQREILAEMPPGALINDLNDVQVGVVRAVSALPDRAEIWHRLNESQPTRWIITHAGRYKQVDGTPTFPTKILAEAYIWDHYSLKTEEPIHLFDLTPMLVDVASKGLPRFRRVEEPGTSLAHAPFEVTRHATIFSTRVPFLETPVPRDSVLQPNLAALQEDSRLFKTQAALLRTYAIVTKAQAKGSDEQVVHAFLDTMQDNLRWLWRQALPKDRERSKLWYDGGHKIAQRLAKQHGVSIDQACAVLAVLSPQTDWFVNLSLAQRVMAIAKKADLENSVFTPEMYKFYRERVLTAAHDTSANYSPAKKRKYLNGKLAELKRDRTFVGERWHDLSLDGQAKLLRQIDEMTGDRRYRIVTPEGTPGDYARNDSGIPLPAKWMGYARIAKALSALRDARPVNLHLQLGQYQKVRSFYNNLRQPNNAHGFVTIDSHAVAAALLKAVSSDDLEPSQAFGSTGGSGQSAVAGLYGLYGLYAEAYQRLAAEMGIHPRELQSVIWEAARGLFDTGLKKAAAKAAEKSSSAAVDALWDQVHDGTISADDLRSQLLATVGKTRIRRPAWADTPPGVAVHQGDVRAGDVRAGRSELPARSRGGARGAPRFARAHAEDSSGPVATGQAELDLHPVPIPAGAPPWLLAEAREQSRIQRQTYDRMKSDHVPGVPHPVYYVDEGSRYAQREINAIFGTDGFQRLAKATMAEAAQIGERILGPQWRQSIERLGVLFADHIYGVFMPDPGTGRAKASIQLNLLEHLKGHTPEQAAAQLVETIVHEFVHHFEAADGPRHLMLIARAKALLGPEAMQEARQRLRAAMEGADGQTDRDLAGLLPAYTASRRRREVARDSLSSSSSRSERPADQARGAEAAYRDDRRDRAPTTALQAGHADALAHALLRNGEQFLAGRIDRPTFDGENDRLWSVAERNGLHALVNQAALNEILEQIERQPQAALFGRKKPPTGGGLFDQPPEPAPAPVVTEQVGLEMNLPRLHDLSEEQPEVQELISMNMDKRRLLNLIGIKMYDNPIVEVAVKELVQNSFDALKVKPGVSMEHPGHIDISIDYRARTVEVKDDGIGMLPQVIKKAFFTVAGTHKEGKPEDTSGGLGLAKISFLLGSSKIHVESTRDGLTSIVDTTSEQILNSLADEGGPADKFSIRTQRTGKPSGTTVRCTIPETYVNDEGETSEIHFGSSYFLTNPLIGPVVVTRDGSQLPLGVHTPATIRKENEFKFNWGTINVYVDTAKTNYPSVRVLSAGTYQFQIFPFEAGVENKFPFDIILDVRPKSPPVGGGVYPFNNSREGWRASIKDDIALMTGYLQGMAVQQQLLNAQDTFKSLKPLPKVDVSKGWTAEALAEAERKARVRAVQQVVKAPPKVSLVDFSGTSTVVVHLESGTTQRIPKADFAEKASFKAKKDLNFKQAQIDPSTMDPTKPHFHNNTTAEFNSPEEQQLFTLVGNTLLAFLRMWGQKIPDSDWRYATYHALADEGPAGWFAGVSIDKEYRGLNMVIPLKAIWINVVGLSPQAMVNPLAAAAETMHLFVHELTHVAERNEGGPFTSELATNHARARTMGIPLSLFEEQLERAYEQYWDAFKAAHDRFTDYDTKNRAASFKSAAALGPEPAGPLAARDRLSALDALELSGDDRPRFSRRERTGETDQPAGMAQSEFARLVHKVVVKPIEAFVDLDLKQVYDGGKKIIAQARDLAAPTAAGPRALQTADLFASAMASVANRAALETIRRSETWPEWAKRKGYELKRIRSAADALDVLMDRMLGGPFRNAILADIHQLNTMSDVDRIYEIAEYERTGKFPSLSQDYSDLYHASMDVAHSELAYAYGDDGVGYVENYVRRMFVFEGDDEGPAVEWMKGKRRSLAANRSPLKTRILDVPLDEAMGEMEQRGWTVKLAETNPELIRQWALQNAYQAMMYRDAWEDVKRRGYVRFVPSEEHPPKGMVGIDEPGARFFYPKEMGLGRYWAPPEVARILNNATSTGIGFQPWYRAIMYANVGMNEMQLGLSLFHGTFTTVTAGAVDIALGLRRLMRAMAKGDLQTGLLGAGNIGRAIVPFMSVTQALRAGRDLIEGLRHENPVAYQVLNEVINPAGARIQVDLRYRSQAAKAMMNAFREKNPIGATIRMPFAFMETVAIPLMQYAIPRIKIGAFLAQAADIRQRLGPTVTPDVLYREYRAAWDTIDDVFGELVYDNGFWNKTATEILQAITRSVGWTGGSFRLGVGASTDLAAMLHAFAGRPFGGLTKPRVGRVDDEDGAGGAGQPPEPPLPPGGFPGAAPWEQPGGPNASMRMFVTVGIVIYAALFGGIFMVLMAHKRPHTFNDLMNPEDGGIDPVTGRPSKVSVPGYTNDARSYAHDPVRTFYGKTSPILEVGDAWVRNRDYNGDLVRDPDSSVYNLPSLGQYVWKQQEPISGVEITRQLKAEKGIAGVVQGLVGIKTAPRWASDTAAEAKLREYEQLKQTPRTPKELEKVVLKREIRQAAADEGSPSGKERLQAALKKAGGKLSDKEEDQAMQQGEGSKTYLEYRFEDESFEHELAVYEVATPEERGLLQGILDKKSKAGIKNAAPDDAEALEQRYVATDKLPVVYQKQQVAR